MMLALLLAASSSSPAVIQKIAVQVPGWPDLPYPFSEGILSCAACPDVPCTLKISGNQGYDHAAGHLVTGGIVNETAYALANIKSIAEAAGAKMDDLISCVVWLANITDFGAMNAVYTTFFTKPYPTRTTTAVALAGSAAVEITCEAVAPCPRPP
jgi:2-iminobutanoate/2-iminopropanoate deaminase|eukprot:jgi/Chrpa1/4647/Chrysochromulina_OHIO_Genome00018944-RA